MSASLPVTAAFDFRDIHAGHGIHGLETGGAGADPVVEHGGEVAVAVNERDDTEAADEGGLLGQVRGDDLAELRRRDERTAIEGDIIDHMNEVGSCRGQFGELELGGGRFGPGLDVNFRRLVAEQHGELGPIGDVLDRPDGVADDAADEEVVAEGAPGGADAVRVGPRPVDGQRVPTVAGDDFS